MRDKVEKYILEAIKLLTNNSEVNLKLYKDMFKKMTNKEFKEWIDNLESGKEKLSIVVPHYSKEQRETAELLDIADKLGIKIFHHVTEISEDGEEEIRYGVKTAVLDLPVFRTQQLLVKGISAAEHYRSRNALSGQVSNESRSSKLTAPEQQLLAGTGLKYTALELNKVRGGDLGMETAAVAMMQKYGRYSIKDAMMYETGVVSKDTLKSYFKAMHIKLDI